MAEQPPVERRYPERRARTWRGALEHLWIEMLYALSVGCVALIGAGVARALIYIAS
jgi:hypothetical protein